MAKGITVDLIVDPKGAITGIGQASNSASGFSKGLVSLGKVGVTALAALATATIGVVTGLTAATKSAGEYAEGVQNAASKTHLSTDAVQELQYASKITGVEFTTISGSLTKLTKSLGSAQDGNKKTAAAFASLGVATTDANGELRSSTDVYADVITALGGIENPTQRDVLAMQVLGKSATALNPLIDGSAGSLSELAAQAHEAGAVMSGETLSSLGSVDDAFDRLTAGTDAAKNALGLVLMPAIQQLGDEGSGLLGRFTNALLDANGDISKAAPEIGAVVGDAANFLLEQIPAFLEVGSSIITSILSGIASQGPKIITAAIPVVLGFVTTLLGQLPLLLDAGFKILIALVQGVAAALPTLIPAAIQAVIGLGTAIIENLPLLITAGIQMVVALALGLIDALPQLIEHIPTLITGVITALVSAIPLLIEAGIQLFLALVTNLPAIILGIIKAVPAIVTGIVGAFTNPKTMRAMADAGLELIHGLWEGIKGAGDWLWRQISGFFNTQIDSIKALLGIASPSTVFAGFGRNIVQGLAGGINSSAGLASSAMAGLSRQVTGGFTSSLDVQARATVASGAGFAGAGGQVIQVTVPVTNSYVGDKDQLARNLTKTIVDGIRTGTVAADWNKK